MFRLLKIILGNLFRIPRFFFQACRYARHPEKYPETEIYNSIQQITRYVIATGNVTLQVFGRENIPETNGFILYGNHQGMFDLIAVANDFPGPLAFVFKKELKNVPLLKQYAIATRSFAMDRADVRQSLTVIRSVTEEVKNGRNYLIFPEGTRSKTGNGMNEFHGGSFKAAVKAKCPILPVAFIDCYKVLDQKGTQPVSVQMHYLPPIPYEEYQGMTTVALAAMVKERIQAIIDQYA